jgi:hypothetical protein
VIDSVMDQAVVEAPALERAAGAERRGRSLHVLHVWPEYLKRWQAAAYLSMSETTFGEEVDVAPIPVTIPRPGKKPVLRYRRADLDAWAMKCATYRLKKRGA